MYRIREAGKLTGLSAGIGDYFSIDVTLVRVLWVVAAIASSGMAVFFYFLIALVVPVRGQSEPRSFSEQTAAFGQEVADRAATSTIRNWLGVAVVALGAWLLMETLWPNWVMIRWSIVWAIALMIIGVWMIVRGRK